MSAVCKKRRNLEWWKFRHVMCHLFAGVAEAGNRVCVCWGAP